MIHFGITGSNGYIGKNLINWFDRNNNKYSTLRKSNINYENNNKFEFNDFENLPTNFFKDLDVIIHLAGIAHNNKSKNKLFKEVNVEYTKFLAEESIKREVKKFIFISSIKAIDQEYEYGKSKFEAEKELKKIFKNTQKTNLVIIRPGLVYGGNPKGNLSLIKNYLNFKYSPIIKFNLNKISMIHVDDLVELIIYISFNIQDKILLLEAHDGNTYSTEDIFTSIYRQIHKKDHILSINIKYIKKIPFLKKLLKKLYSDSFFKSDHLKEIGFKCKKNLV